MTCLKPVGHHGRCRDTYGRTWDNNHPPYLQPAAVEAARTLTRIALHADPMTDADYDAQTAAALVLAPLLEVTP